MSDPTMIEAIQAAVTIPVMAKARIGHFVEAQVLEALEVDYVDESEVLTPADEANHIDKWGFKVPFVCGATNLGEALRRIAEGAAMIRSKGEAGTGNVVEAVRHMRQIGGDIRRLGALDEAELPTAAKELQAPLPLVRDVAEAGKLPVVMFSAGGVATPADAALMMRLGAEGVFVGSGHLQVRGSRAHRRRRRRGDHPLRGRRAHRRGLARPRRADDRHRHGRDRRARRAAPRARLVTVGVLALQGDFEAHRKVLEGLGARGARGPHAGRPRRARRARHPRRRVDDDDARHRARAARRAAARARPRAATPVLGTCAGLIMLDRDHLGLLDVTAERNAFGRQVHSFEADLDLDGRRRRRRGDLHPRAVGRASTATAWRCSPRSTGIRWRCARATSSRSRSIPSSTARRACTSGCSARIAANDENGGEAQ